MSIPLAAIVGLFILAPVLVIYLESRFSIVKKIGAVLICYAIGLVIGNIGILPEGAANYQDLITTITIPLALPLILFSIDVKSWFKRMGSAVTALITGLISVLAVIFIGFFIFHNKLENSWHTQPGSH